MPSHGDEQAPVAPPSYYRAQARYARALHVHALTLIQTGLASQCPCWPLCPPLARMGRAPLPAPPSHHPTGCGLLGTATDPLDPCHAGSHCLAGSLDVYSFHPGCLGRLAG
jgi:hypothetical protein